MKICTRCGDTVFRNKQFTVCRSCEHEIEQEELADAKKRIAELEGKNAEAQHRCTTLRKEVEVQGGRAERQRERAHVAEAKVTDLETRYEQRGDVLRRLGYHMDGRQY